MIGWLYDYAYGQDVRVYDTSSPARFDGTYPCLGWFFWNGKLDKHEQFGLYELLDLDLTMDEIRLLVFAMFKISYCGTR